MFILSSICIGKNKQQKKKSHGMYECIKHVIREIMNFDIDKTPKNIHEKIINDYHFEKKCIPNLKQVQNFVNYYRKVKMNKNLISEIQEIMKKNQLRDNLPDNEMFFFNMKFDSSGSPKLGDGSEEDHLMVCATSKSLLERASMPGMKHVDCTYKIIKNGSYKIIKNFSYYES
jgi:hypothetical protein